MPNRIIKESAFESEKIASLSDFEFRLWIGLITQADDAGRGDARPAIIKGRVFALRDRTTVRDIDNALHALAAAGCIDLYNVGGRSYFRFPSWADHQRIRDIKPKYPGPEDADPNDEHFDNLPQSAANCGLNPIQSNTNPNPNPNPTRTRACESAESVFSKFVSEECGGDEALLDALKAFFGMRKQIKKPLSVHAAELVVKRLQEFPRDTWVQIVDQSVMNCWQGLFPLDRNGTANITQTGKKNAGISKKAAQRNAECQPHNVISPGMMEAARKMLEEDV